LQREVSVISRVIVHPKYRSIGLGEKLSKKRCRKRARLLLKQLQSRQSITRFLKKQA